MTAEEHDVAAPACGSRRLHAWPECADGLLGGALLRPPQWRPVLGRVVGLVRRHDGTVEGLVALDGRSGLAWLGLPGITWRGIGPRTVGVPVAVLAPLGRPTILMGLTPERLQTLPDAEAAPVFGRDETIEVGFSRPFH